METVFRFVTVRNPRKPTSEELATGFVRYNAEWGATLMEGVMAYQRAGEQDKALGLLKAFKAQQAYLATPARLREYAPELYDWADWLSRAAPYLTRRQLREYGGDQRLEVPTAQVAGLWDNLLAYTYAGGRPEVREAIIWMLRVIHLHLHDGELDDEILQRLAQATVLIPTDAHIGVLDNAARGHKGEPSGGVRVTEVSVTRARPQSETLEFPSAPPPETAGEPPPQPSTRIDPDLLKRIARLQAASDDLFRAYQDEVEVGRAEPPQPLRTPRITAEGCFEVAPDEVEDKVKNKKGAGDASRFEERVYNRLRPETIEMLGELRLSPQQRIPYALQLLQSESTRLGRTGMRGGMAARRVYRAGGAFWTYTGSSAMTHVSPPYTHKLNPKALWRGDEPYADFYSDRECMITPLGIADFRRVEQELCCYEPGEVAHIENVLIGETRERSTRRLRRTEEFISLISEEESTTERDSQTTDRFELQKETNKQTQFDLSFELGVQVAASYGPVSITADTNFSTSHSTTESDRAATTYANEVINRALERIVTATREERSTRTIEEFEENNRHAYNNDGGANHIVGLYRWLDKVYTARVVNYGKRLMVEFMIPEPAAFHLFAMTEESVESGVTLAKPIDPRTDEIDTELGLSPLRSHESILTSNYALYAAAYGARVDPPPAPVSTVSKAYHREAMDHTTQFADSKNDLALPIGYEASRAIAPFGIHAETHSGGPNWITIAIGQQSAFFTSGSTFNQFLNGEDVTVPVVLMGRTRFYAINVEVECTRTAAEFDKWQIKTFNAIIDAYNNQLAAYNNALAEAKASVGLQIRGTNPAINRQIEALELKKGAIRLMAKHCAPLWSDAMKEPMECEYPEFDCCEAIRDGSYVQFVEQAFEWKLLTYLFYPYFWGRKCNWKKIYQLEDADPLFLGFLQAGYARVVVPVRPGYHSAVLRFLADGVIWNGGAAPGVDSDMYVSLENEMKEPVGVVDPNIAPWPVRVPTTLVALQCESGCVPGSGLPCPCKDEEEAPAEEGDG